jgi:hypothetical protein
MNLMRVPRLDRRTNGLPDPPPTPVSKRSERSSHPSLDELLVPYSAYRTARGTGNEDCGVRTASNDGRPGATTFESTDGDPETVGATCDHVEESMKVIDDADAVTSRDQGKADADGSPDRSPGAGRSGPLGGAR